MASHSFLRRIIDRGEVDYLYFYSGGRAVSARDDDPDLHRMLRLRDSNAGRQGSDDEDP